MKNKLAPDQLVKEVIPGMIMGLQSPVYSVNKPPKELAIKSHRRCGFDIYRVTMELSALIVSFKFIHVLSIEKGHYWDELKKRGEYDIDRTLQEEDMVS